jgi:hypothetical protein
MKARIVEPEEAVVARERHGKDASAATEKSETIEELSDAAFSMRSLPRPHTRDRTNLLTHSVVRVSAPQLQTPNCLRVIKSCLGNEVGA